MKYNFDQVMDRARNHSAKYDERKKKFGTEDVIPLWIADMDFKTAQPDHRRTEGPGRGGHLGLYRPAGQLFCGHPELAEAPQRLGDRPVPHELQPGCGADSIRHASSCSPRRAAVF